MLCYIQLYYGILYYSASLSLSLSLSIYIYIYYHLTVEETYCTKTMAPPSAPTKAAELHPDVGFHFQALTIRRQVHKQKKGSLEKRRVTHFV